MKKLEDDQFLDLMTVKTEVRAVFKEPYRSIDESLFLQFFSCRTLYLIRFLFERPLFYFIIFFVRRAFCNFISKEMRYFIQFQAVE